MRKVQVSAEYLDSLCEWMLEWVKRDDAYTVPQFLQWKGIGYPYLKYFCYSNEKVNNTFEIMKSILHNRWFHLGMHEEELPPHRAKMLMRYLRFYDGHGLSVEKEMKEAFAEAKTKASMQVHAENYAREELQQPYRGIYEENANKRRGGRQA